MTKMMADQAAETIKANDKGRYTVPTHGLYPFQWNWDSCLTALGFSHFDMERAWIEIETLFEHQWDDGMVPHIIFHEDNEGYFPGPTVWNTGRPVPTSGITQPPVAGYCLRKIYERTSNQAHYHDRLKLLVKKIYKWHSWFFENRDPENTGLVAIIHPWESGRDNSIDWDLALDDVPQDGVAPFIRRDTQHADPEHRPTENQYQRYIWLVQHFASLDWQNSVLHDSSPFKIVDPGFNAMLIRSIQDLAFLATEIQEQQIMEGSLVMAGKARKALESLWDDGLDQYVCYDRSRSCLVRNASIGGLIPVLADIPNHRKERIAKSISNHGCKFGVPSQNPQSIEFERYRYWRGPVWLIINYMISEGLKDQPSVRNSIIEQSLELIEQSGFAEYYDPIDGRPCGGQTFSWTAAMVLEFLGESVNEQASPSGELQPTD